MNANSRSGLKLFRVSALETYRSSLVPGFNSVLALALILVGNALFCIFTNVSAFLCQSGAGCNFEDRFINPRTSQHYISPVYICRLILIIRVCQNALCFSALICDGPDYGQLQ